MNTKLLCDLIGSRYYPTNNEIEMDDNTLVKVYDENDVHLGEMTLLEARDAAKAANKDVVMRNAKITPPVCKILNYKKELLKRLFKKLGKDKEEGEVKMKSIKLST